MHDESSKVPSREDGPDADRVYGSLSGRAAKVLSLLPLVALVIVATVQIILASTLELTPWKGGGFGMFASGDSPNNRPIRVVAITREGTARRLKVPPPLAGRQRSLMAMPTERRIRRFAEEYVSRARWGESFESLRVEVWRGEFDRNGPRVVFRPWRQVTVPVRLGEGAGSVEIEEYEPERDDPLDDAPSEEEREAVEEREPEEPG